MLDSNNNAFIHKDGYKVMIGGTQRQERIPHIEDKNPAVSLHSP